MAPEHGGTVRLDFAGDFGRIRKKLDPEQGTWAPPGNAGGVTPRAHSAAKRLCPIAGKPDKSRRAILWS